MRKETFDLIQGMKLVPWFQNVGKPIENKSFMQVGSWKLAMKNSQSDNWEAIQLQVTNYTKFLLNTNHFTRFDSWNPILREVKAELNAQVGPSVDSTANTNKLPVSFKNTVMWDLFSACMETEFQDVVEPMFFLPRALPVYAKGHFLCGWDGEKMSDYFRGVWPNGRLIVY